jgi:hypothetical protein
VSTRATATSSEAAAPLQQLGELPPRLRDRGVHLAPLLLEEREGPLQCRAVFGRLDGEDHQAPQVEPLLDRSQVGTGDRVVAGDVVDDDEIELAADIAREARRQDGHHAHQAEQPDDDAEDLECDGDTQGGAPQRQHIAPPRRRLVEKFRVPDTRARGAPLGGRPRARLVHSTPEPCASRVGGASGSSRR